MERQQFLLGLLIHLEKSGELPGAKYFFRSGLVFNIIHENPGIVPKG